METQAPGAASDKGRKYELSVAALLAFHLSENMNVEHYHISSELKQYHPFDDIVVEVRFKELEERQIYAIQTKCGKDKFKIKKYTDGYEIMEKSSPQFEQNIREDRIQFWYFNPVDIINFKNKSDIKTVSHKKHERMGSKDILDITNCYKLDYDKYEDFFKSFYLFLKQPNTKQIIRKIKDKWKIEDPWQIIFYFDKQFAKRGKGVDKASFEHELLKIRLSNYIVTPTEATLFRHQSDTVVNDWNRLTLKHNVTIVCKELNIEQHLHGCILQNISNIININKWNEAISSGGKLDKGVITHLKERSMEAETLKDFMVEMWVKNEVPLFLQTDAPLPILEEFRNLNKSYIIIDSNPEKRFTEIEGYNLSVFRRLYDVKDDYIIKNIAVSLQGRQQASLDEIIDEDKELMKAITCLDIINLIKPREVFLKEECLDGINYMLFLIETSDPQENYYDTLRPTGDNITISCRLGESLKDYERFRGDSRFRSYKIYRVRSSNGKLILLPGIQEAETVGGDDEKCGLEYFFVDQNGESVYNIKDSDPIPIIGEILIHVRRRYVPRYLRECINKEERQPTCADVSEKKKAEYDGKIFAEHDFFKESNSPVTIITGEPGIGKTTLLHSLFRFCETKYYVLFVNLAKYQSDLNKRNPKLFQNPLYFLYDKQGTLPYNRFLTNLRNHPNRLILILDSFDEVVATSEEQVLQLIENLQKPGLQKIVIASRLTAVGLLRNKFATAEIFKLEDFCEELGQYIGNWNLNINDLNNIPSELLHNPLHLGMLRTLSEDGRNLAVTNRWDLFDGIVNLKMENYCRRIEPYCLDENEKQDILSWHWQLALQVVTGANEVTQKLTQRSRRNFARVGFITNYDDENPIFVHRTLAEFFLGQWLIEKIGQDDAKFIYRLLLDRRDMRILNIISERLPLHKLILRSGTNIGDLSSSVDESNVLEMDALGRSILSLTAILSNLSLTTIWKFLEFLIYYMRKKKYDIYIRDSIMKWTWIDYIKYHGLEHDFLQSSKLLDCDFITVREAYVNYYATRTEELEQFSLGRNFSKLYNSALYHSSINMIQDLLLLKYHQDEAFSEFRRMCLLSHARTDERLLEFHLPEEKLTGAHLACIYSNTQALKIYIENQTNLNENDIFNCTPLHYGVIAEQNDEIVELLLKHCKISHRRVGQFHSLSTTILHMIARTGNVNVTRMILEQCGDLQHSRDSDDLTPYEIALKSNLTNNYGGYGFKHFDVLKAFLEKENAVQNDSIDFIEIAVKSKNMNVARILLNHGVNASRGLYCAVLKNDVDFTELFLKNDTDPNHLDAEDTVLILAITQNVIMNYNSSERESNLKIIDLLLQYGASVHKADQQDRVPLDHIVIYNSADDVVQKLLDHKTCNVDLISQIYLHKAIKHRRSEIVELFLKKGARVDCANDYGRTPLNYAVKKGEKAIVQMLLEYKADINGVDRFGFTPLITAVEMGNIEIAELLLLKGAKVDFRNEFGMTALYVAAFKRNVAMIKLLLEKGADVNTVILSDQILYNAKQAKKIEAVVLLLKNRTISQPPDTASNHSESDLAVNNLIEKVRRNWADVNLARELRSAVQEEFVNIDTMKALGKWSNKESHGEYWTAVFCLCEEMYNNNKDVDNAFLQNLKSRHYVDLIAYIFNTRSVNENLSIINVLSRYHETGFKVFERAVASGNREIVQIVLQNYNDPDTSFEFNPLCYAVCIQDEDMIKILLKRNCKVNRPDALHYTPIEFAAGLESIAIAEMLLKNGADVNLKKIYGGPPLHIAALLENRNMVDLFLQYGANRWISTVEYTILLSRVKHILIETKSSLVVDQTMNSDRIQQIIEEVSWNIPRT